MCERRWDCGVPHTRRERRSAPAEGLAPASPLLASRRRREAGAEAAHAHLGSWPARRGGPVDGPALCTDRRANPGGSCPLRSRRRWAGPGDYNDRTCEERRRGNGQAALGARGARAGARQGARTGRAVHHDFRPPDRPSLHPGGCRRPRLRPRFGDPGQYPYTRGIHPTGYRGKLWTMRQFAGFGTPAETNERSKALLARADRPERRLRPADADRGCDPDDPLWLGEVGKCGVAVVIARRHGEAVRRHHVTSVSVSGWTINASAPDRVACTWPLARTAASTGRNSRHHPERHPQGVHRAEGVHLPAARVHAADHR